MMRRKVEITRQDMVYCLKANKDLETLEQELKIGRWVTNSDFPDRLICSCCNTKFDMWVWEQKNMHYCPNCGIKIIEL